MASSDVRRSVVLTPVTALGFFTASSGERYVLVGEDTQLKIYTLEGGRLCSEVRVFKQQAIHGLHVSQETRPAAGRVLIWGGRSVTVCLAATIESLIGSGGGAASGHVFLETEARDWVYDAAVSPEDENAGVLVTAHNEVVAVSWTESMAITFGSVTSPSRPILYAANLRWLSRDCVLVAGGTVFGEILVWKCYLGSGREKACSVSHVLTGHEGSIFGVHISEEVDLGDGQVLRLLASCSDDRTIRVWDISEAAHDDEKTPDEDRLHEARETGFGSSGVPILGEGSFQTTPIAMAMGHLSRIWHVKFPSFAPGQPDLRKIPLYSFGEDSTAQVWDLDLSRFEAHDKNQGNGSSPAALVHRDTFSNHDGKHLWAAAVTSTENELRLIATGGADGKVSIIEDKDLDGANSDNSKTATLQRSEMPWSTEVSHETLPLLEASPEDAQKKNKRTRHDFLQRYVFVTDDTLLATTKLGKLLVGHFGEDIDWSAVTMSNDATQDDLKMCLAMASPGDGIAVLGTAAKTIYLYAQNRITALGSAPGKVLNLICLSKEDSVLTILLTMHDNPDIRIYKFNLDTRQIISNICLEGVDERFALTSAAHFHGYLFIGSRSSFMEVFKASDGVYAPCLRIDPRADDAITSIIPLPGQDHSPSISFLTTCRDGKYRIYELDPSGDTITVHLRHETAPPFGPQIENAWFCKNEYDDAAPPDLILSGFRSKDFVVWNETRREQVVTVDCGGAHRTFAHTKSAAARPGSVRFAFTKASKVYLHSQGGPAWRTLKLGTHGREIRAVASPQSAPPGKRADSDGSPVSYFATGSEDTAIRIWGRRDGLEGSDPFRCVAYMKVHTTGLQALKWCGGEYLLSSGGNEDFFVWRVSRVDADYSGLAVFCEGVFPDRTPDCDLRITDFDVRKVEGEEGCLEITLAFSNSVFKTYRYRSPKAGENNRGSFELLATGEYTGACLTQVRQLGTRSGSAVSDVLTASTDGHVALWTPDGEKQSFTLACSIRVHQSSIKSLDMHTPSGSDSRHYLVMTTGDDNALAVTSVKTTEDSLTASKGGIVRGAHAAAINGVVCLPDGRVATASNDQRLKIWEVRGQGTESPWAVPARDFYSGVADAGAVEYLSERGELVLVGVGMEAWSLEL